MGKLDKRKRLHRLEIECGRIEQAFIAHHEVVGHPDFCSPCSVTVISTGDCLMGSAESAANIQIHATPNLSPERTLKLLRRAVKWMEYDVKLRERERLRAELGKERGASSHESG